MNALMAARLKERLEQGESLLWEQSLTHPEQIRLTWPGEAWGEETEPPCISHVLRGPIRLVICGGGHVAQALAASASAVGFAITVLEDRAEMLDAGRFPVNADLRLGDFSRLLREGEFPPNAFYAVMTRSHGENRRCLRAVMERPHGYAGMLGSRRDRGELRQWLVEEGAPPEAVARLHHPIGCSVGAETPAEIAVAVTAELIQCRRTLGGGIELEPAVLEGLLNPPYAWVMLAKTEGITPRKPGACMLVYPNGSVGGTIGGGTGEAAAVGQALEVLRTGRAGSFTYPQAQAVPRCGGTISYTIVPVKEEI